MREKGDERLRADALRAEDFLPAGRDLVEARPTCRRGVAETAAMSFSVLFMPSDCLDFSSFVLSFQSAWVIFIPISIAAVGDFPDDFYTQTSMTLNLWLRVGMI
jgi:hypothetical protein